MKRSIAHPVSVEDTVPESGFEHSEGASDLLSEIGSLWRELTALTQEQVHLAALETQRAGKSLITVVIAAVLLAILALGVWLGLWAAGIAWLVEQGLPLSGSLLLGVIVNLVAALIIYGLIRYQSRYLQFPATRRSLRGLSSRLRETH
ncbi:MAG: phage holin family protein [Methylobacter sp.]|nr:phage holin family protein [Methylobacter sp.]